MKKELDEKLCEDFPEIFKDRHGDKRKTAMCWGFECGDGWYGLIYELCDQITRLVSSGASPPVVASQVKEKYGTLRFSVYGGNDLSDACISVAEQDSAGMCEMCGEYGRTRGTYWLETRCIEHASEGDLEEWELKKKNKKNDDESTNIPDDERPVEGLPE